MNNVISKEEKQHIEALAAIFAKEEFKSVIDELKKYRAELIEYIVTLSVSSDEDRSNFYKGQGKIELIDMWISMPERMLTLVDKAHDLFTKIFA